MIELEHLKELARFTLDYVQQTGKPDEAEILVSGEHEINVGIENGAVKSSTALNDLGLGIRVAYDKQVATTFTTNLTDNKIKEAVDKVVLSAKKSKVDEDWMGLPTKSGTTTDTKFFYPELTKIDPQEISEIGIQMISQCKVEGVSEPIIPVFGQSLMVEGASVLLNSYGVEAVDQVAFFANIIGVVAIRGGKAGPIIQDFVFSRDSVLETEQLVRDTAKLAYDVAELKQVTIPDRVPVVFHPFASSAIISNSLNPALRADVKQQGNSFLGDRLGEELVPQEFELYDDGITVDGMSSSYFDAEGVARQKTPIFENGIFKSFLYDHQSAQKDGTASTGNASRVDQTGVNPGDYANTPSVNNSNTVINSGTGDFDSLIKDIPVGLYVVNVQGAHQGSPESGDYTGVANPAFIIRNGELAEAVAGFGLAGHILDLFKNYAGATKTTKAIGNGIYPYLRFDDVRVVSK